MGFVAWLHGCSIADAHKYLEGKAGLSGGTATPVEAPKRTAIKGDWTSEQWQVKALQVIQDGERELARPNCPGRIYLCARGLEPETMSAYRIGYDPRIQAVAVPWIDARGRIMAIKYRRIMPDVPKGQRFNALKGGQQLLFGLNQCTGSDDCIAVEGEINAMSIAQAVDFDVVSFGGESMVTMLAGLARKYKRLLIWHDDPKVSARTAERLGRGRIRYVVSPGGLDANDLLQRHGEGALKRLIERLLTTEGER